MTHQYVEPEVGLWVRNSVGHAGRIDAVKEHPDGRRKWRVQWRGLARWYFTDSIRALVMPAGWEPPKG